MTEKQERAWALWQLREWAVGQLFLSTENVAKLILEAIESQPFPDQPVENPCPRCGATPSEIAAARAEGNATFYLACGCDFHGDHAGCNKQCRNLGCTAKLRSDRDTTCDHTRSG